MALYQVTFQIGKHKKYPNGSLLVAYTDSNSPADALETLRSNECYNEKDYPVLNISFYQLRKGMTFPSEYKP